MDDFSYSQRNVEVVFADGALRRLADAVDATLGASRVLLVSTPGRAPIVEAARGLLGDRVSGTFDGARPHVPADSVAEAVEMARGCRADCLIAIGGGSAIGLGKAVVRELRLPLVAVPTTYSGSEMTDIWGMSEGDRKQTGRDSSVAPRLVLYDPQLTYTMPREVTASSGLNAIAHSVEALYSRDASPISDLFASEGIERLAAGLRVLAADPETRAARWAALYGAHLSGRALDMTSMGLHHKLCHALGGIADLPHALTHAVVLPHSTAYNASSAPGAMRVVASRLGAESAAGGLWELNQLLGISQTLADLGLETRDIGPVVEEVMRRPYDNPAPVTAEGVRELLTRAMEGTVPR